MSLTEASAKQMASAEGPMAPEGCRIYAVGDIHGRADLVERLLIQIALHSQSRPPTDRQFLVFLGDYINRGSQTKTVIDILTGDLIEGFEAIFLKGNHEVHQERYLRHPVEQFGIWLNNGGGATMASYGVDAERIELGQDFPVCCRDMFVEAMPKRHKRFFQQLKLCVTMGDYFFVHAGVRPGVPLGEQSEDDLLWIDKEFLTYKSQFDKVVVHGHTPLTEAEVLENRISIDTHAWYTGRLTAVMLEGYEIEILATPSI